MIVNIKRFIDNAKKMYPLHEDSFPKLGKKAERHTPKRNARAHPSVAIYQHVEQSSDGHARSIWKVPSQNPQRKNIGMDNGGNYTATVEVVTKQPNGLFGVVKALSSRPIKVLHDILAKSDVRVHCTCPDFYYGGGKYNAGKRGNLALDTSTGYPGEKDVVDIAPQPNKRNNLLCKHLIMVKTRLPNQATSLMKDVRNFDVKIETDPHLTEKEERGEDVQEKDKNLLEVTEEDKQEIIQPLMTGMTELAKEQQAEQGETMMDERNEIKEQQIEEPPEEEVEVAGEELVDEQNEIEEKLQEKEEETVEPEVAERIEEEDKIAGQSIVDKENELKEKMMEEEEEEEGL